MKSYYEISIIHLVYWLFLLFSSGQKECYKTLEANLTERSKINQIAVFILTAF